MTTAERIAAIENYLAVHNAAMEQMDRLDAVFGSMPEGPFQDTIYRLDSYARDITSACIGDAAPGGTWLTWWLYERPSGDVGARINGREYPARTVPELVALIEAWNGHSPAGDAAGDTAARLEACRDFGGDNELLQRV